MGDVVDMVGGKLNASKVRRAARGNSSVVIQVERGQLRENLVEALTAEDASALVVGLAMALVQLIRAQQIL